MTHSNSVQSLPIDIHYNKLLDWLLNRRHCTQQCQAYLTLIRDKIGKAVEASRQESHSNPRIKEILAKEDLNYYLVKELFELLKGTDAAKTNLIGQYSVQSMKNWNEIVKLYGRDGTYLVEAAQILTRNVNFEVPAIKKQIHRLQQTQKECSRKETECMSSSLDMKRQYAADCKRIGIEGKKIKTELSELVKDLPNDLNKIGKRSQGLSAALEYYDSVSSFIIGDSYKSSKEVSMLRHIVAKGNTTTFEWRKGRAPSKVVEMEIKIDTSDEQDAPGAGDAAAGEIDWGAVDLDLDAGIDFGEEIDFDIGDITVEGGGVSDDKAEKARDSPDSDEIDWCIVDQTTLEEKDQSVAKGTDALCVLDNQDTRNAFINDLHEIQAFLTQRLSELTKLTGTETHLSEAPSEMHLDGKSVQAMHNKVSGILTSLASEKMSHLLLIRESPRYVDRIRDSLTKKLILADKMAYKGREMEALAQEANREEVELHPEIDDYRQKTKFIQARLQDEISSKYDGRKVNIVGEINTI